MDINIKLLANKINMTVENLISACISAGIKKTKYDFISEKEKKIVLKYIKKNINQSNNFLTLKRKVRSTLNIASISGRKKSVPVEIRKKRTYIKLSNINHIGIEQTRLNNIITTKDNKFIHNKNNNYNQSALSVGQNKNLHYSAKKQNVSKINTNQLNFTSSGKSSNNLNLNRNNNIIFEKKASIKNNIVEDKKIIQKKRNNWSKSIINKKLSNSSILSSNSISNKKNNNDTNIKKTFSNNKKIFRNNKIKNSINKKIDREKKYINYVKDRKNKNSIKISLLKQNFNKPSCIVNRDIILSSNLSVSELANKMAVKSSEVTKIMIKLGYNVSINQIIEKDIAQLVAEEMGHKVIIDYENKLEKHIMFDRDLGTDFKTVRPPIVTIMGHVDHGKTSLLDTIRVTKIASKEAGGITQHIGAYYIKTNNKIITFLDTPGHSAFTAMRARGARVTDIVVLVIAADDGIKPQTIEAIQHAQAAEVPILVAINKIDKCNADPEKIKNELMKYNIVSEEWGGDNIVVNVSAKSGEGIDNLLDSILIQSEMLELKSAHNGMASGLVIEASLDKGRGPTATILVKEGKLCKGDVILCGLEYGKVRDMKNILDHSIESAGPSIPVKILGLSGIPIVGDEMIVVRDERKAREVALYRQIKFREKKIAQQHKIKLSNLFDNIKNNKILELNIILKSDVQGSLEAISDSLLQLSSNEVKVKIIGKGIGSITETDATLALASNAIIIGFNVRADVLAKRIIELENIDLRYYSVIYEIINEIKSAMTGMLSPSYMQKVIGLAHVRNIFKSPKFGTIAGCMVTEGLVKRNKPIRILRNNIVIYEGELSSLRRFKEDIFEVRSGIECGIGIKNYSNIEINDLIEVFETIQINKVLS